MSHMRWFVIVSGFLFTMASALAQTPRTKVLFDTDIGTDIDDAWALGYVVKSPVFEVLGVTVTDADTPPRAKIACKVLHRLGLTRRARGRRAQDGRGAARSRRLPVHVGRGFRGVPPDRDAGGGVSRRHDSPQSRVR